MNKEIKKIFKYIPERNKIGTIIRADDSIGRIDIVSQAINQIFQFKEISLIYIMIHLPKLENGIR